MPRPKKGKPVEIEQEPTIKYKVEFISDLYSLSWGYRKGTIVELDYATYIIAQKYNSIKDL